MHGIGTFIEKSGARYEGDFAADSRSGDGNLRMSNGNYYKGEFLYDKMKGRGTLISMNMQYNGEFDDNLPHGKGIMRYGIGLKNVHEGYFEKGLKHGKGKFTNSDGKVYFTEWKKGMKQGRFFLQCIGSISEGYFENDELKGDITTKFENGDIYVGNGFHGYREGEGRMVWANHPTLKTYEGEFFRNKMHGKGKLVMRNGFEYEGEMSLNKFHGLGTFTTSVYTAKGDFFQGKPKGDFELEYFNGDYYKGGFENFKRNGRGKFVRDSQYLEFNGEWFNGKKHGLGVLKHKGITFIGRWANGVKQGEFIVKNSLNRQEFIAFYKEGKKIKQIFKSMRIEETEESKEETQRREQNEEMTENDVIFA